MINGSLIHIKGVKVKSQRQYAERLRSSAREQAKDSHKSIAYIQSFPSIAITKAKPAIFKNSIVASVDCSHEEASGVLLLKQGTAVIRPCQSITIRTKHCDVLLKKGAAASITTYPTLTIIRACNGVNSTRVQVGTHRASLAAGEELLISKLRMDEKKVYEQDEVSHRDCRLTHFAGFFMAHSEFSIPSLLSSSTMKPLLHPKSREAQNANADILKSAVALQMVRRNRGAFSKHPLR